MEKRNIAILFGGCSPEYSVSLESAYAVITHLDREMYHPILIGISQTGNWYHFTGKIENIRLDTWNNPTDCTPVLVSPGRDRHALFVQRDGRLEKLYLDAAFPVLHGKNGEDGTVQGLMELAGIPLVGCGVLACALCMDKHRAHKLAQAAGVAVPAAAVFTQPVDQAQALAIAEELGYPLFVKPLRAGSSYGITKVAAPEKLPDALALAFSYDSQVILEETISGFEVGCAVLGNSELTLGALDEVALADGFFNFTEKYALKTATIHVPARISPEKTAEIKEAARRIYKALGCQGFARVDLFLDQNGRVVFNEVNPIPGFTVHSRYPSMMQAIGISLQQVISDVIELAVRG